jgi:hypothetical protein
MLPKEKNDNVFIQQIGVLIKSGRNRTCMGVLLGSACPQKHVHRRLPCMLAEAQVRGAASEASDTQPNACHL